MTVLLQLLPPDGIVQFEAEMVAEGTRQAADTVPEKVAELFDWTPAEVLART